MPGPQEDKVREKPIIIKIVIDAYNEQERAMGWYYYLEEKLRFPFTARCIARREVSLLEPGDEVEVVGISSEAECEHEMFVNMRWHKRNLAVPLSPLEGVAVDKKTQEVIENWHYWVEQGYEF